MKTISILLVLFFLVVPAFADPKSDLPSFDRLETLAGKVYQQAKVTRIELDTAIVYHSGGVVRIAAADLAESIRTQIPYDLAGAEKVRAAVAAEQADLALDKQYPPCEICVEQVVEGGVIARVMILLTGYRVMNLDLHFVELDTEDLGLIDGQTIRGIRLEKLEQPYTYQTVFGARATIPRWRHYPTAHLVPDPPLSPEAQRLFGSGPTGGQADVNRILGR